MDSPNEDASASPWKRLCELRDSCVLGACHDKANISSSFDPSETSPLREVSVIRESGLKGCPVCRFLLQVVDEIYPEWTSGDTVGKRIVLQNGITLRHHGTAVANFRLKGQVNGHLYPQSYLEEGIGGALLYAAPLLHGFTLIVLPDTFSTFAFDRARAWLEYCENNDPQCRPSASNNSMPRRLLDVESRKSSDRVLLIETVPPSKYVCLSYCWGAGSENVLRTVRSNRQAHMQDGIEYKNLPKTIRDAVYVCRGLEIPYIWIDSLCIVQDDPTDWASEAPRMAEIYGRSHLTIYANHSDSSNHGLLGSQNYAEGTWQGTLQTPLPKEYIFPADAVALQFGTPLRTRIAPGTETDGAGSPMSSHRMAQSKLDKRGWCLQEELLPNRRLYFDGNEMTWECCTRSVCECGHMNEDRQPTQRSDSDLALTKLKMYLGLATPHGQPYSLEQIFQTWKWVLEDYTSRFVTNSSDKLVAVSGIASMILKALKTGPLSGGGSFSQPQNTEYCAGLWRQNFLVGLSWTAVTNARYMGPWKPPSRSIEYRAPTWSWASNNAPIEYVSHRVFTQWTSKPTMATTRTRVDEILCQPLFDNDITGQIKSGYARLTGPLVPVELVRLDQQLSGRIYNHFETTSRAFLPDDQYKATPNDIALVRGQSLLSYPVALDLADIGVVLSHQDNESQCWMERACSRGCCGKRRHSRSKLATIFKRDKPQALPHKLFCFELFTWEDDGSGDRRTAYIENHYPGIPPETWFLVLREVSDGVFERVGAGLCEARSDRELDVLWPKVKRPTTGWNSFECPLFGKCDIKTIKII